MKKKIIFMGTPESAVAVLSELYVSSFFEVVTVFTQPDRAKGRGKELLSSPVKQYALKFGLPVKTPYHLRERNIGDYLKSLNPDLMIVVAYGCIIPRRQLRIPSAATINIHTSLLPLYRGPNPIPWSIIDQQGMGITVQLVVSEVDAGPILFRQAIAAQAGETAGNFERRVIKSGAKRLEQILIDYLSGHIYPEEQIHSKATYARKMLKKDGLFHWHDKAERLERILFALRPWPVCYTFLNGIRIQLLSGKAEQSSDSSSPGKILETDADRGLLIACGEGALRIGVVKPENSREMTIKQFICGHTVRRGQYFESPGSVVLE